MDKPLVPEPGDLEKIESALLKNPGVNLLVLYTLRSIGSYEKIRELITDGVIGHIATWRSKRAFSMLNEESPKFWEVDRKKSGGIIVNLASHEIDLMYWILGEKVEAVTAYHKKTSAYNINCEDNAQILFKLTKGITAYIEVSHLVPRINEKSSSDSSLEIVGSKGKINYDRELILTTSESKHKVECSVGKDVFVDFMKAIYEGTKPSISNEELLKVSRTCFLARDSADRQETIFYKGEPI